MNLSIRMNIKIALLLITLLSVGGSVVLAQSGGQFCLLAFEDRNANGLQDAGEPLLTRGIAASLLDSGRVIIASALLDESPTANLGTICFTNLPAGQYTLTVTSGDYRLTTLPEISATISAGGLPTRVDFGAQRIDFAAEAPQSTRLSAEASEGLRLFYAAVGGIGMAALTAFVGFFIYAFGLRAGKRPAPLINPNVTTTGTLQIVSSEDIPEFRRK